MGTVTELQGLGQAIAAGGWLVLIGLASAVAGFAVSVLAFQSSSVVRGDQLLGAAKTLLSFGAFAVLIGAVVLLGVPAIQTADPARRPPPPSVAPSTSAPPSVEPTASGDVESAEPTQEPSVPAAESPAASG